MGNDTRLAKAADFNRSRAFLYGESVFTSIRVERGSAFLWQRHEERLKLGAEWLWPGTAPQVEKLWQSLEIPQGNGVWRLTLSAYCHSRGSRLEGKAEILLDEWWSDGLPTASALEVKLVAIPARPAEWPSFLKSGDYLSRLVAARHLSTSDIPLFHVAGKVTELLHANFAALREDTLFTPPLGADVLAGLGRERLLWLARQQGLTVIEQPIKTDELEKFDALLAVNAVRGLVPIEVIDGRKTLGHPLAKALQDAFFERR